jgi:hypothetical protein
VSVGGFASLASLIGQHPVRLYEWVRGERMPKTFPTVANDYLFAHTGLTAEQLFRPKTANDAPEVWKIAPRAGFTPQCAVDFGCDLPKLMLSLDKRERRVILLRLQGATLEEIGAEIGVTKERIRQNEARALKKIRWRCLKLGYK